MKLDGKIYPIQSCPGVNYSPMALINFSMQTNFKKFYDNPSTDPLLGSETKAMLARCFGSQKKAA